MTAVRKARAQIHGGAIENRLPAGRRGTDVHAGLPLGGSSFPPQCAQKIQHRAYVDLNLGASFPIASLELSAYIARRMARSSPGLPPRHVARFLHPAPVQDESQRLAELQCYPDLSFSSWSLRGSR